MTNNYYCFYTGKYTPTPCIHAICREAGYSRMDDERDHHVIKVTHSGR